jgi:hypothetical protein
MDSNKARIANDTLFNILSMIICTGTGIFKSVQELNIQYKRIGEIVKGGGR